MAINSTLRTKLRIIIGEYAKTETDIFVYESSDVFILSNTNAISVTKVYKNDVSVSESGNWSYDSTTNRLSFLSGFSLLVDDVIKVEFSAYPNYSDTEIDNFIKNAVYQISIRHYKIFEIDSGDVIQPEPSEKEENLIVMIAGILMKPDNKTIRTPDLTIIVPKDSMPVDRMIDKVVGAFKRNLTGVFAILDI